jgi:glycosyltransferase involved in cell wall biosynthesis
MPGIGIDTTYYERSSVPPDQVSACRSSLGVAEDTPIVVMVGELNRNKRPSDVLRAVSRMRHRHAHLAFLGDGPLRHHLEEQARELGIDERVTFKGVVADVRPYLVGSSVLVLASKREGLPRSIMEALSLEVPVVATSARGSHDLVGQDAGWVVPIGDVRGLATALDQVLDDPDEAKARAIRGRARMISDHATTKILAMHEALYGELLESRARR